MKAKNKIRVYVNNDDATIVWQYAGNIPHCLGFALYRKHQGESDAEAEPVQTSVGFAGDPHTEGEMRPSTEWPIQKYVWMDYYVRTGDTVCYRIVPMIGEAGKLKKDIKHATPWSAYVTVGDPDGVEAYFNRGLVSSQFVARRLNNVPVKERSKTLSDNLADVNSKIRNFMGGNLLFALYRLLQEVKEDKTLQVYAALYELNEAEIIRRFKSLGKRAHIILANGAFSKDELDPEAENAAKLKGVDLIRRVVKTPHFAHNKFIVVTQQQEGKEVPVKVWTGSTNLTRNGLFTQVNNAIILKDPSVAMYYKKAWDAIKADCDDDGKGLYGKAFKQFNATAKINKTKNVTTFFTPVPDQIDMEAARTLIRNAKKGVLFLMFKPGVAKKSEMLYDTIREVAQQGVFVNGVINSDPGGAKDPTISFFHKNDEQDGDYNVVLPGSIGEAFEFWAEEVGKKNVTIHSKAIVIDPFSANPVLITGSHNMGSKASASNDDNLNIITGNKALVQAYAIHMMAVYHHYRWRFYRSAKSGQPKWSGNVKNDSWQQWYRSGAKAAELAFWLDG